MGTKSKKKKGPKGKKARAKAKLEQVWGEHVDEDARKASRTRVGKSKFDHGDEPHGGGATRRKPVDPLSNRKARGVASTFDEFLERSQGRKGPSHGARGQRERVVRGKNPRAREGGNSSSDDSSGEDSEDDTRANGGSFATLLQRISGPQKSSRRMAVDSEDDLDEEDESHDDDTESDSDSEATSSSKDSEENADDMDETIDNSSDMNGHVEARATATEDPYVAHFSTSAPPQLDSPQSAPVVPHAAGSHRKVTTTSLLNSSVDVHMSGPLLESWDATVTKDESSAAPKNGKSLTKKHSNAHTRRAWEDFAAGPYQHVREVLARNWKSVNRSAMKRGSACSTEDSESNGSVGKVFSPLQLAMYPAIARYADVLISSESRQNTGEINHVLCLHTLNHVLTSRTRVQRHNRRIKELANSEENSADQIQPDDEEGADKWRDQGYTRPKVLVLLPTRGTCWNFVKEMMQLLGDSAIVDDQERFDEEYGPLEQGGGSEDSEEEEGDKSKARRAAVLKQKGAEWNDLFGDVVNSDDDFKMGISLTPNVVRSSGKKKSKYAGGNAGASGVSVKLFADFYRSDIILASPIGLTMATTSNDDDGDGEDTEADVDFLSSIDICIVARSDVLLMQNWDHVSILDSLNRQPKKVSDIDFSRVRNYFLNGQGTQWRQLIMVSKFADPHVLSTFRRHAKNIQGQLKIRQKVPSDGASICDVMVRVKQVFQRVACQSVSEAGANRLRYFSDHVLPKLIRMQQKHTLLYIPSYFDFIAVRNMLLKLEADFVSVTEYARVSEVSRGRARFLQGRKSIMVYTGRAHYFLRHKIKGARHVIFFGLPEHAEFYPAVVNMLNDGLVEEDGDGGSCMPMSCLSLFTKFDAHRLERVVGTSHTERMTKSEKNSYMFCS